VWFPDHPALSESAKIPDSQPQTNQRAELMAIARAIAILDEGGYHDVDVVVYTDSEYSINCLTKWIPGWVARRWKTSAGGDVLHRDLIEETSKRLAKCKSHRFVHVRAHTGGTDDISIHNDRVDRMARSTLDESVSIEDPPATDGLFDGCPLHLMGPPIAQARVVAWMKTNLATLDPSVVDKYLFKAFTELCKAKDVTLTKQIIQKQPMLRAERMNLQILHALPVEHSP
jgi:ribonuclease HI